MNEQKHVYMHMFMLIYRSPSMKINMVLQSPKMEVLLLKYI